MLVENGILREKHEEHENQKRLEGNIYIGKVQNVLQGMQSAFINIGEEKNTFIRLKDLLPKVDETKEKVASIDERITIIPKQNGYINTDTGDIVSTTYWRYSDLFPVAVFGSGLF